MRNSLLIRQLRLLLCKEGVSIRFKLTHDPLGKQREKLYLHKFNTLFSRYLYNNLKEKLSFDKD